jgi:hypothetical protein
MKNTSYNAVNKIINSLPTRSESNLGNLTITGVDDNTQINTTTASSKNWNIVV